MSGELNLSERVPKFEELFPEASNSLKSVYTQIHNLGVDLGGRVDRLEEEMDYRQKGSHHPDYRGPMGVTHARLDHTFGRCSYETLRAVKGLHQLVGQSEPRF